MRNLIENSAGVSVMCGDSLSDLGALLIADLGIVIGENSTLKKFLALAAVPLAPLSEGIFVLIYPFPIFQFGACPSLPVMAMFWNETPL